MYVTRVRLTDIKGFSGRRAIDLRLPARGGWTMLAGRNGSGKSTLLQAIALALCGPQTALALNAGTTGMVTRGADSGAHGRQGPRRPPEQNGRVQAVAEKFGIGFRETLRDWVKQHEIDAGTRPGMATEESAQLKALK
ncbi:ATP-binding protein [Streptomyces sp. NBC_01483]|uniref:ATP-binding protein n=1 Tax=Streptomyces sp. NBC_01483 TaxID=2903883 RepID=UPI002E3070FD|nr:AAA family ATPase [Streptomyces sp. NBC_01483]